MSQAPGYAQCKRQIDRFAARVNRRLLAAGVRAYDLEDITQECAIAYVIAAERWDPTSGVPFAPYLAMGMRNHVNRWCDQEVKQSHGASMSLDHEYLDRSYSSGDTATLHDAVGASQPDAYELYALKTTREKVMAQLTERTKLFVELFESPPEFLVAARNDLIAKAKHARDRGMYGMASDNITATLVFDFMDAGRMERHRIRQELHDLSKKVSQC